MYAIVEQGGKQYRVEQGELVRFERIDAKAGGEVRLSRVLLVADDGKVHIGTPTIKKATVVGQVTRHLRAKKVFSYKYKRRKNYHRKVGHRQALTEVRINEIRLPAAGQEKLKEEVKENGA